MTKAISMKILEIIIPKPGTNPLIFENLYSNLSQMIALRPVLANPAIKALSA